ncbi:hypothetical protein K438DRAFT_1957156 [Mycena galopus ATCC 62051]|nr:hypothetical protein K438DRAFT_1957156 [Mycena galopus ATCC 62051]
MANLAPSDADRLRIAIALTALKFKPANQSCACERFVTQFTRLTEPAYVLQLRSKFPPSTPTAPTTDGSWKTHALALEKDLADLKQKYETEQIKTLITPTASASDATSSTGQSVKRKPKKKATANRPDVLPHTDLETVLESLHGRSEFASLPSSNALFSGLSAFQELTSALWSSEVAATAAQRSLLLSSTNRALTSLACVLHSILLSQQLSVVSQVSTLQILANLMNHLISSSLPFLLRKPKHGIHEPGTVSLLLNKLLNTLITSIFDPIVESFLPLSRRYLASLFPTTPSTILPADLRPEVLHLFQNAFHGLVSVSSAYEVDLRATIALTALRELENLFPPRRTDGARLPRTHDNRLSALARKDTLWYLCTILRVVFTPPKDCSQSRRPTAAAVAERKIVDSFSRIVNRCRRCQNIGSQEDMADTCNNSDRDPDVDGDAIRCSDNLDLDVIDEVGYQMILGVMERFWRWTGELQHDSSS